MPQGIRNAAIATLTFGLVSTLCACGRSVAEANSVTPAGDGATATAVSPSPPQTVSADASKTGQAFLEELEHNPALFEKQRQICHGHGADSQPNPALEGPCAAWDMARQNLELDEQLQKGGVKNTDGL
jgi:hypothetical protein